MQIAVELPVDDESIYCCYALDAHHMVAVDTNNRMLFRHCCFLPDR
jgi:hypothetical protein